MYSPIFLSCMKCKQESSGLLVTRFFLFFFIITFSESIYLFAYLISFVTPLSHSFHFILIAPGDSRYALFLSPPNFALNVSESAQKVLLTTYISSYPSRHQPRSPESNQAVSSFSELFHNRTQE